MSVDIVTIQGRPLAFRPKKRSGCETAETALTVPFGKTSSNATMLSKASPYWLERYESPVFHSSHRDCMALGPSKVLTSTQQVSCNADSRHTPANDVHTVRREVGVHLIP